MRQDTGKGGLMAAFAALSISVVPAGTHIGDSVAVGIVPKIVTEPGMPNHSEALIGHAVTKPKYLGSTSNSSNLRWLQYDLPPLITKLLTTKFGFAYFSGVGLADVVALGSDNNVMGKFRRRESARVEYFAKHDVGSRAYSHILGVCRDTNRRSGKDGTKLKILVSEPRTVGFDRGEASLVKAQSDEYESSDGGDSSGAGKPIQIASEPYLSPPIVPLVGLVAVLFGAFLNNRGMGRGPFRVWALGWTTWVLGAAAVAFWAVAAATPTLAALNWGPGQ